MSLVYRWFGCSELKPVGFITSLCDAACLVFSFFKKTSKIDCFTCFRDIYLYSLCIPCTQHGQQLYRYIYLGCKEPSSGRQHYETLFALLGLLSVELANEEVVVDLIRLALALQVWLNVHTV